MADRPVLRRKPLRYQNVGRKSALTQSLSLKGLDPNLQNVGSFSKRFKSLTTTQRNQITRYVSDYISEEIGLGKKVKNPNIFTTPQTAPDGEISLDRFEKLTGIRVSQTQVVKGAAANNLGFFESKVKGFGDTSTISLGAIDIAGKSEGFGVVGRAAEGLSARSITGKAAYDLLNTAPQLRDEWARTKAQINEKFENLLMINVVDADKGKRVQLDFVSNPLGTFNANDSSSFLKHFNLIIKPREKRTRDAEGNITNRVVTAYRIESIPKASLRAAFNKQKKDITNKIIKGQTNAFSKGLELYLIKRLKQYAASQKTKPSEKVMSDFMGYVIALANEFKEGGQTPIVVRTSLKDPNFTIKPGSLRVTGQKQEKAQKFISGAQISALVRRRLGDKMPNGPRRGPPLSANILTERSGRFRSSIEVIPDYRRSVMAFFYDPLYKVFVGTQRDPDEFVGETVREVVQGLYSRAFKILRV